MQPVLSFFLSTVSVVVGVVAKSLWDKLVERQEELARTKRTKKLEILERQLSEFYWPLYLKLEKDNLIWHKVFDREQSVDANLRQQLETDFILPNHSEIMEILETKIYLARAHQALSDQILQYIQHIAIYQAIRKAGILDRDPLDFGIPFPTELFRLVKAEKDRLQRDYDQLLDLERKD